MLSNESGKRKKSIHAERATAKANAARYLQWVNVAGQPASEAAPGDPRLLVSSLPHGIRVGLWSKAAKRTQEK